MLDWLVENFHPSVIVVERNPFNVMASWIELNFVANLDEAAAFARKAQKRWNVAPLDAHAPQLAHQTFAYGVLVCTIREAAARHDDWTIVSHEQLCSDPPNQFHALAANLGLPWGDRATEFLAESNRDGTGFKTNRRAKVQSERWRERLNEEQIGIIRATLSRFPSSLIGSGCFVTMMGIAF